MTTKITVGPPVLTINKGRTFMVTDYSGEIDPKYAQGVFTDDTRYVSTYHLWINGTPWTRVSSATVSYHSARLYLTNPEVQNPFGEHSTFPSDSVGLEVVRSVDEGITESFQITNFSENEASFIFEIELMSDFADLFEVKSGPLRERENITTEWNAKRTELTTTYRDRDYLCRFTYKIIGASPAPSHANGKLRFPIHLAAHSSWRTTGQMVLQHGQRVRKPQHTRAQPGKTGGFGGELHQHWLDTCTNLDASDEDLDHTYTQSVEDMGALRLFDQDLGPDVWVPAAGVPWYVTLFGRDSLIASLQNMMVRARFAEGALRILGQYQAHDRDDWRDAQPGKILHEARHGELAHFKLIPQSPAYYGTWDATPLYLMVLHQAWRWLGDRKLVQDLLPVAELCLEWIDKYGDLDGDGFQEYKTFSSQGYQNMSWKDAADAVVYPNGSQVKQPKALCELQGYVYAARMGMAEVFEAFGQHERANTLVSQAADLKRRFNQAFWVDEEGTYAFGLDPEKHQIKTVASNAGHCLWTGIADDDKAARVVQRLLADDMWSGWGIRTLSAANPAFNPLSYQRGSVWPHDNAILATGMHRYGRRDEGNRVTRAILDAASRFQSFRLPEVFAGLQREPVSFPVQYLGANIPQAWAAGSVFQLVQAMLGLEADVPNGRLLVNPCLPDWLDRLTLSNLAVGQARLDLRFWREGGRTRFCVESRSGGQLEVQDVRETHGQQPAPKPPEPGAQAATAATQTR